jgi:subtilisin family serine protease
MTRAPLGGRGGCETAQILKFRPLIRLITSVSLFLLTAVGGTLANSSPHNAGAPYRDGIVLLAFQPGIQQSHQNAVLTHVGAREIKCIGVGVHVVAVRRGRVPAVVQLLRARREVRFAEPDYLQTLSASSLPNDTFVGSQWAVRNTGQTINGVTGKAGADEKSLAAWGITTGTNSVVVAVLDTGVQYSHPDLLTNMWNNPGGIGGCSAGTHGYNVLNSTCDPMDDDTAYGGHGTHVAGILGAVGNDAAGTAGVNWTTSIMALKWVNSSGSGATSDLITAMDWVVSAKQAGVNVRVVNDSQTWVGTAFSQALSDEIDLLGSHDILFVTASGNTAQNNDVVPRYACSYARPTMICVAASDQNDNLWSSANYGPTSVQLAAPGANIYSTLRVSNYGYISGGSMASPQVAGTAALILSLGYQSVTNLRSMILNNVDLLSSLSGLVGTSGRLNVCRAVPACSTAVAMKPAISLIPVVTSFPRQGGLLGASTGAWTGIPSTYTYQWDRCDANGSNCSHIPGASGQTYALLAPADALATIAVTVTASNSFGSTAAQSSPSGAVATATSPSAINSSISSGATINGSVAWSVTPSRSEQFVQFYIDGVLKQTDATSPYVFNGSTSGVLDTTTLPNGPHVLGARALFTDNRTYDFYGETVTVANPPQNTALPAISGTLVPGQTISTSNGSWNSNAPPTGFSYQWEHCDASGLNCAVISGAVSSTYLLSSADAGFTMRAAVTALNSGGSTAAVSAQTAVVAASSLVITTSSLPVGQQNVAYSATVAATGGTPAYTWSIASGSLPVGLTLASNTGVISGTPTTVSTSNFTARVTDTNSLTATKAFSLSVTSSGAAGSIRLMQANGAQGSNVTSLLSAFPVTNTAGDLIIAFVRMSTTSATVNVTDTLGNTYVDAVAQVQDNDHSQVHVFYAKNILSGANTVKATFSSSNSHSWLAIFEYAGMNTANPLDKTAHAQGHSTVPSTGATPTTTSANELVFAGFGLPSSYTGTQTAGTGYTLVQNDTGTSPAATESMLVTSTGSYTATFSLNSSSNWSAVVATFAGGGIGITTTSLPNATQNSTYNKALAAAGGVRPYTWAIVSGSLPAGLTLTSNTGLIAGTPTGTGISNFTAQVTDSNSLKATRPLSLTVMAPPTITTTSLPTGTQNAAYSTRLAATGGTTPYVWSISSGTLPTGLALASSTGVISGTPTGTGISNFTVHVSDANAAAATQALSLNVVASPIVTTASLPGGTQNGNYSASLAATGGTPPYTWSVSSGALPAGLALASSTGVISGTPTGTGTSTFTVLATDANLKTGAKNLGITVAPPPTITTSSLPSGTQNAAYNTTMAATGGTTPYSWSISVGALPTGLALVPSTGVISGTPTGIGTSTFTVKVTDASSVTATKPLSLTISASSGGGIGLVQENAVQGSAVGSVSVAFPTTNTAGNLILAFVRMSTSTQTVTLTDRAGNTYAEAVAQVQTTDGSQVHLFYAKTILGAANTVTATFSSTNNHPWLAIYEYRGLNTNSPLDQTAHAQGSDTAPNSGSTATTTSANELVFAAMGLPASYSGTQTLLGGYSLLQNDTATSPASNEYMLVTSTGSFAATFTLSATANWSVIVATFKP